MTLAFGRGRGIPFFFVAALGWPYGIIGTNAILILYELDCEAADAWELSVLRSVFFAALMIRF